MATNMDNSNDNKGESSSHRNGLGASRHLKLDFLSPFALRMSTKLSLLSSSSRRYLDCETSLSLSSMLNSFSFVESEIQAEFAVWNSEKVAGPKGKEIFGRGICSGVLRRYICTSLSFCLRSSADDTRST
jgi:hypothetical protein